MVSCGSNGGDILQAERIDGHISIDGDLADWPDDLEKIIIEDREINQGDLERILSDNIVGCRSVWNEQFLFLSFDVKDSDLNAFQKEKDHAKLYLDDMVEFLFDPYLHQTEEWRPENLIYHINLLNTVKDDRGTVTGDKNVAWDGVALHQVKLNGSLNDNLDKDDGYVLEVAIPWQELGVEPKSGLQMGFNFANGDNDGKGRQLFDWMGAWPMRTPSQFGILNLIAGKENSTGH